MRDRHEMRDRLSPIQEDKKFRWDNLDNKRKTTRGHAGSLLMFYFSFHLIWHSPHSNTLREYDLWWNILPSRTSEVRKDWWNNSWLLDFSAIMRLSWSNMAGQQSHTLLYFLTSLQAKIPTQRCVQGDFPWAKGWDSQTSDVNKGSIVRTNEHKCRKLKLGPLADYCISRLLIVGNVTKHRKV